MTWFAIVGVVVLFLAWGRRSEGEAQRQHELAHPSYDQSWEDARFEWEIDFTTMTAKSEFASYSYPPIPSSERSYELRRVSSSQWEMKLEMESWRAEVIEAREMLEESPGSEISKERLEELEDGPHWKEFAGCPVAVIERDYQRFVAQYRGPV